LQKGQSFLREIPEEIVRQETTGEAWLGFLDKLSPVPSFSTPAYDSRRHRFPELFERSGWALKHGVRRRAFSRYPYNRLSAAMPDAVRFPKLAAEALEDSSTCALSAG
jgi:hypothetical protein